MILLHHLARTGGTLISRCLAAMDSVYLLSEINPLGVAQFDPVRQAAQWHGFSCEEDDLGPLCEPSVFAQAIRQIQNHADGKQQSLLIRDWSHLDLIGFPFNVPPLQSSWESVVENAIRVATVRHPVDQYLSCRRLGVMNRVWDDAVYWRGVRLFSESIQEYPWFRYEDFLAAPQKVLQQICEGMSIRYDSQWKERWPSYRNITGDDPNSTRQTIAAQPRKSVNPTFWQSLRGNDDFTATLDCLGYPTPEPLRRKWYQVPFSEPTKLAEGLRNRDTSTRPDWDEEVARMREACEQDSTRVDFQLRLAESLCWIGQTDEAADRLLSLCTKCDSLAVEMQVQVLQLTCRTLDQADRRFETIEIRRRLAGLAPEARDNLFQLSLLLVGIGEVDEALTYSRQLLNSDQCHDGATANYLLYINYSDRYTAAEIAKEHFRLGMRFAERPQPLAKRKRARGDRLRVGYLASDFYTHPVGKIMLPILQAHDSDRLDIRIYHDGKKTDQNTETIRGVVDQFHHIHGLKDDAVVDSIRRDDLDVLIDLGGYTGGGNRMRALARRVAPVQASFLGYPNTSAIHTIDYHVTDRYADPPGSTESLYGEQLVWLQHSHVAWRPYGIAASIEVEKRDGPVLGVFNNVAKISSAAIRAFAAILNRVPDARLIMKYGDRYGVAAVQNRFRHAFAELGIVPHRIEFRTKSEPLETHLRTMASVDLALDSFPYQGTMTSLECLSVGTPVLSRCGAYYAHRATSAMMMRMDLNEFVASDSDEYVEIAVQLLGNLPLLRSMREVVRDRFMSSALTDPAGLVKELEEKMLQW